MTKLKKLAKRKEIEELCRHHWVIEPPLSDTSLGICKYCGITKEFMNNINAHSLVGKMREEYISEDDDFIVKNSEDEYI